MKKLVSIWWAKFLCNVEQFLKVNRFSQNLVLFWVVDQKSRIIFEKFKMVDSRWRMIPDSQPIFTKFCTPGFFRSLIRNCYSFWGSSRPACDTGRWDESVRDIQNAKKKKVKQSWALRTERRINFSTKKTRPASWIRHFEFLHIWLQIRHHRPQKPS